MKKYVNKWVKNIESWLADGDPSNTTMTLASGDGFKRRVMYGEIQRRFPGLGTFKVDGDRIRIFAEGERAKRASFEEDENASHN